MKSDAEHSVSLIVYTHDPAPVPPPRVATSRVCIREGFVPTLNEWLPTPSIDELTLRAYVSTTMAASDAAPATPVASFMACVVSSPSSLQ